MTKTSPPICRAACLLAALFCSAAHADAACVGDRYVVDAAASEVRVQVYRGGLLGGFGHNHVISLTGVSGDVELCAPLTASALTLRLPVAGFVVDAPAARRAAGEAFAGNVAADDVAATRSNMLGPRLLDAGADDVLVLDSGAISGTAAALSITMTVGIRGARHALEFPVELRLAGDTLTATGRRALRHGDIGLRPFSAAFGTLRVKDEMLVVYTIVAQRAADPR